MTEPAPMRLRWLAALLLAAAAGACIADDDAPGPIHQLRIYEIFDGTKAAFHDRFRDHAARIMARHGFDIVAMWETKADGRIEFAYLLQWPDEATMKKSWTAFMADQEWSDIKQRMRAQGPLVGEIEDRTLHLTDYSPRRDLLR